MSPTKSTAEGASPRSSKTDVAYDRICANIIDGTYPPGSRLVLDRVARDLDMSTLPVREAIRRLEAKGYVQFQRNVGATVRAVDAESYVQATETVAVLEGAAIGQVVGRLSAEVVHDARTLNEAMAAALDRLDGKAFLDAHDAVHDALVRACPNAHLVDVIAKERARLRQVRGAITGLGGGGGRQDVEDHVELLRLIEIGAPTEKVEDFVRAHLERPATALRAPS